jgi:hypothetical protein
MQNRLDSPGHGFFGHAPEILFHSDRFPDDVEATEEG